jgi:hypothetical protein
MDEMEFTEAESNMNDLVFPPLDLSTANTRSLNTNNIKMPQSITRRSMMKRPLLRKLNKLVGLCKDALVVGSVFISLP